MKGQYLIVSELMLFALGILITAYVLTSFNSIRESLSEGALSDHFRSVSDIVATGVVRTATSRSNTTINFPTKISERDYVISLKEDSVIIYDLNRPDINVTQKLFNITQNDIICNAEPGMFCSGNTLFDNAVVSPAGRAEIYIEGNEIKIRRI